MNPEINQACTIRKKESKMNLLKKSGKFFTFMLVAGYLLSVITENLFDIDRIYFYFFVGLVVSSVASYFKLRVWLNPEYHTGCNCADSKPESMLDGVFTVLSHKKSALLLNIPNTVFGILSYLSMILLNKYEDFFGENNVYFATLFFAVSSTIGSLYLWFTMVNEVRSVCVICSTIHAMSFLILFASL